jgi:hypothetical protein
MAMVCHVIASTSSIMKFYSSSFADDPVILSESQAGLQNSLNKLEKYCYKWQLTVNTNKTKIMIFQGSNHSYSIFFL